MESRVRPSLVVLLVAVAVGWGLSGLLTERALQADLLEARELTLTVAVIAFNAETRASRAILRADSALGRDSVLVAERDALAAEARSARARFLASREAVPPLPDSIPPECAGIVDRQVALQDALIDAEEAYTALDEVRRADSARAASLRVTADGLRSELVAARDALGMVSDSLAEVRRILPVSIKPTAARLALVGRGIAIAGRPLEGRVGLRSGMVEAGGLIDSKGQTGVYAAISLDVKIF